MKKTIITLTAAALLASAGTFAFAQGQGQGAPAPLPQQERQQARRGMSQDDFNRLVDARVASIKAGLKLTADQESLWAPVEAAIRANAAERFSSFEQRRTMREQRQSMDFMQRLEQRSTSATENAQRTSALTTAFRPLWNTFSEDQKRIAPRLMRQAVAGGMGWDERGGRRGDHGRGEHGRGGHHRMGGMMGHGGMGGHGGMMGRGMDHGGPQAPAQQQ